jgi:preprotein translocase subunit SecA
LNAQKKVEERNFSVRKNLLEYDEVMDYQRTQFYGMRQKVLEGREVDRIIWDMIGQAIEDAVNKFIVEDYVAACVCEWAKTNFGLGNLVANDFRGIRNMGDLETYIKSHARNEVGHIIGTTLDEFMGEEREAREWDTRSLSSWAMSQFQVNISQGQLKKMSPEEVEETIHHAAIEQVDKRECSGLAKYLEPVYAETELGNWAMEKFNVKVEPKEMLADEGRRTRKEAPEIVDLIEKRAREAYSQREIEYPIDHLLVTVYGDGASTDDPYRADYVRMWVKSKYGEELSLEEIRSMNVRRLRDRLLGFQEQYMEDGRLEKEIDALTRQQSDPAALAKAVNARFAAQVTAEELAPATPPAGEGAGASGDGRPAPRELMLRTARAFFRKELTDLEQFVLITIFDHAWKDHLYAMDMLRTGIGLQAFAEKDPRIAYKREGYRYFGEMMAGIRDQVTNLIFRARIVGDQHAASSYNVTAATHEEAGGYGVGENLQQLGAPKGGEERASGGGEGGTVTKPIVRETPKVGRNDPCPCGSGRKYKKCCGKDAA